MDNAHVTEFGNHTLALTLSDADGRPVLDHRAYLRLAQALREAEARDDVRVVVLRLSLIHI